MGPDWGHQVMEEAKIREQEALAEGGGDDEPPQVKYRVNININTFMDKCMLNCRYCATLTLHRHLHAPPAGQVL